MTGPKAINLALQGGGAHGAYTWGVCDRLLEDGRVEVAGISGTSAGALNGAAIKAGLAQGGPDAARENLAWLWGEVERQSSTLANWFAAAAPGAGAFAAGLELSPGFQALDAATRMVSPYAWGPLYANPLRPIVERFSYDAVCSPGGPRFFVNATNVRTGKVRIFDEAQIRPEVLMAAACLPTLFKAVEVDGEAYWDGGYTGNPALFPLYAPELPDDIVIVNINPLDRPEVPRTAQAIQNRINEIGFNTSLLRELRAIDFVHRLVGRGTIPQGAMKDVLVHMIADDALMRRLSVATKLVPTRRVIHDLFLAGRAAAGTFLERDLPSVGERGTVDLRAMFA